MLVSTLFFAILAVIRYKDCLSQMPDRIYLEAGKNVSFDFDLPVSGEVKCSGAKQDREFTESVNFSNRVSFIAGEENSYEASLKLFGILPYKNISIETVKEKLVIPVGIPIGMYGRMDGISVQDTGAFIDSSGKLVEPCKDELYSGDYIVSYNHIAAIKKKEFIRFLDENGNKPVLLGIRRDGELTEISLEPKLAEDGRYKIGAWVRDSLQGIGTITCMDEEGNYVALGHGVNSNESNNPVMLSQGSLYRISAVSVNKGKAGVPGDLLGVVQYTPDQKIGTIVDNTSSGIEGQITDSSFLNDIYNNAPYRIGFKEEIVPGKAEILLNIGANKNLFEIEIEEIRLTNSDKGIVLKVTDPELLEITGGIVQGMSGSPILQNGKIVGAITHVFIQDPTKGYGIFVEEMLNK